MRDLIEELKNLKVTGKLVAELPFLKGDSTPLDEVEISEVESALGFPLPTLLKTVYTEISNGGFGPAYGLLGLKGGILDETGMDTLKLYHFYKELLPNDPYWFWPEKLLPVGYLGCAMYCCVDCSLEEMPVIWFEPNPHADGQSWDDSFLELTGSFEEWLFAYIDGKDLFQKFYDDIV